MRVCHTEPHNSTERGACAEHADIYPLNPSIANGALCYYLAPLNSGDSSVCETLLVLLSPTLGSEKLDAKVWLAS